MRNWLKSLNNQKGMTLIELMGVIIILGVVATVATAAVVNASEKAKTETDNTAVSVIKDAVQRYLMNADDATAITEVTADELVTGGYLREIPRDSAGVALAKVAFTYSNGAISGWQFSTSDTTTNNNFAPKATNK